ncbi:MAG: hypothetical protein AAB460_02270 [Patescibacteria group bacterium]
MKNKYIPYTLLGVGILILAIVFVWGRTDDSTYLKAARAGGDYLVRQMHEDGSFVYEYDPISNKEDDSYNLLRHAGTTYSLLELYEVTRDTKYLTAAERALTYLRESAIPCPVYKDALCILEENEIKLGGNGLAILALAKYMEVTSSRDDLELAEGLARFAQAIQAKNGKFLFYKMDKDGVPDSEFVSEYYPGEAMFGLARLSGLSDNKEWLNVAHKGAEWIILVRDAKVPTDDLPHDHWLLYALNELYADTPNQIYADHTKRLVEAIVSLQHRDKVGEEAVWNGGYYNPPRSTPTATRSEGLGAAYYLLNRAGDPIYAGVAKNAMEKGVEFQLRTQMTSQKIHALNASGRALGGFHETLDDYTIRIDYVQHNISALLALEEIVNIE